MRAPAAVLAAALLLACGNHTPPPPPPAEPVPECRYDEHHHCDSGALGACEDGIARCEPSGTWGNCVPLLEPEMETCNGIDDDCNGVVDDHLPALPCAEQRGVCHGSMRPCRGFSGWGECGAPEYGARWEPVEQTCDGLDNDCDGAIDRRCVATLGGGDGDSGGAISGGARFRRPRGLAFDGSGHLFIADADNHRLKRLDLTYGNVDSVAGTGQSGFSDGPGAAAQLDQPEGLIWDSGAGVLYVADAGNNAIRVFDGATLTTLAGTGTPGFADGPTASARFDHPSGLALRAGVLYVADRGNHRIRAVDLAAGTVSTFAGDGARGYLDGPALAAHLASPGDVAVLPDGTLAIADTGNEALRLVSSGVLLTLAGRRAVESGAQVGVAGLSDGPGSEAMFDAPTALAVLASGELLVADRGNHAIRRVTPGGEVSTLAGSGAAGAADGLGAAAAFDRPEGIAEAGGYAVAADSGAAMLRSIRY